MIGDCVEREEPFGIVLIREGREVGAPARPFPIGTAAQILQVEHLAEGRMNILTRGQRRFHTAEITQTLPHLVGQVRYLAEEPGEVQPELMAEVSEQFGAFTRNLSALAGGWTSQAPIPDNPVSLSYNVASNLDLPRRIRQELLEAATASQRLEQLLPLVKRANDSLQQELAKRNPFQGPRLN
jgi:Lon protease-like protein